MLNGDALANAAARACARTSADPGVVLATAGLNARVGVVRDLALRYKEFSSLLDEVEKASDGSVGAGDVGVELVREFTLLQALVDESTRLLGDADVLALVAGMYGFMERFVDPERGFARIALRCLERCEQSVNASGAQQMVIMGMWFSDYDGFQRRVEVRRAALADSSNK